MATTTKKGAMVFTFHKRFFQDGKTVEDECEGYSSITKSTENVTKISEIIRIGLHLSVSVLLEIENNNRGQFNKFKYNKLNMTKVCAKC